MPSAPRGRHPKRCAGSPLALGIPEVVETCLTVNSEKFAHHRQLEELALDFADIAVLYEIQI